MIPRETIDNLVSTWNSVSALGATLTEEQWKLPTECPGWSVQDNLSHLIGTERMLHGLPAAAPVEQQPDYVKNAIGGFNENEVEARRAMSGAEVLAEWDELVAQRTATLRNGDEEYFATPAMTPTGPGTIADFLHIRVLDCWAHELDMRRAVGAPANLDTAAAGHTIDRLLRTVPIVIGKRAGTPEGATVVLELTGPIERTVPVTVIDGRAKIVDRVPDEVLATVRMDSTTFAVLSLGRCAADGLDGWSLEGDRRSGVRWSASST